MPQQQRLLIVDDDDVIALAFHEYLEFLGCEVDTAHDYEQAKALVVSQVYAVALVEVFITGETAETGLAFLRWLREASPRTAIIVLSAYRTAALHHSASSLGAAFFLDKPKQFDEIVRLVRALTSSSIPGATV